MVCFRVNPGGLGENALAGMNRKVLARMFWDAQAFLSSTMVNKRCCKAALRAAMCSFFTDVGCLHSAVACSHLPQSGILGGRGERVMRRVEHGQARCVMA